MEVHHHPTVEKKNFKEYFLEFLMIFLAVTLGFFAENLREHFKNNYEIKSDMQSMMADLQSDVAMFNGDIAINQLSDRRTDTLISLLKLNRSNTSLIYFLARYITANNNIYTPDTRTFDQMKSSGALKLIESRNILDSISDYYQSLQFFNSQSDLQRQKVDDVHSVNSELFDGYTFQHMFANGSNGNVSSSLDVDILQPENNPPLLSNDFNAVNKVIIAYHYLYATTEINNEVAVLSSQHAQRLINVLKKEYHL
ncbi:MAG TPA: hypothetical protein VN726_00750 [Hanamia sp.]|nr:hypothetical protein [Hanamia sp.]